MTQPTSTARHRSALGAYVALYTVALGALGFVARPAVRLARRARRDEAGFSDVAVQVALGSLGVLLVVGAFLLFKPVIATIITKIQNDIINQT